MHVARIKHYIFRPVRFDEKVYFVGYKPTMDYVLRMLGVFSNVIFNKLINKSSAG